MNKTSTKRLFLLSLFTLFIFHGVFGQTITVGAVDPGPYGQGSSIEVPININDASGCIATTNTFNVYLSNASGSFSPGTLIGSYTGFYAGFINATIPAGTPAGTGYKVEVQSTSPAVTSSVSSAFSINTSTTGVTAAVSSTPIGSDPNIFGRCIGINGATFSIKNTSSTGTTTANFFNEGSQAGEGSGIPIPTTGYTFTAKASNYTISVKNVDGSGNVATKGYQLINNVIQNNFGSAGNGFVCLASGMGTLSYTISTSGASGISANYPGNTYVVNWGDGTSTTYTVCQIAALGGIVSHTFTLPSCGQSGNGVANSFYVQNQAFSPYCGQVSAPPGISAKVLITPITSFTAPAIACSGTALTIPNTSQPGPDPNATTSTCTANPGALYDWTLDGVSVAGYQGVPLGTSFVFPAGTTSGTHTLTLHSELPASGIGCQSADYTQTICFEKPPVPAFTIAAEACAGTTVTPANTSVASNICSVATYAWTVTGPGTVTYAGGTTSTSKTPQFVFPTAGTYTVKLGMLSGCGTITTTQTINIDSAPTISMSATLTLCGSGQTLTFSPTQTTTKTTFGGTTVQQPTTYAWAVTAAAGGTYSFVGGTNANSEYPQIQFNSIDTYTVLVTNTNTCGSTFAKQKIIFALAPVVNAGPDQTVCASAPATTLAGTISGTYSSYQWTGGAGTFSPSRTVLNPVYTPSTGEIAAGSVTLTFQGNSTVPAPCNIATDNMTINITPTPAVNSAPTAATCSKQALSYGITANQPLTTFTWTASATTGTPTGFTAVGSGSSITDVITNNGNTDAVVTYNITPTLKGCPGPVFPLIVTIHPLPIMTAAPVTSPICSSLPANIALSSNVVNTTYTWTSTAAAGVTGNTNQSTAKSTTSIQDILVNSNTVPASVSYTVTPYNGTCAGTPVTTSILVEPSPVIANAGPNTEICNATSYTLQGNSASPGTGKWTVVSVSGPGTPVFVDATNPTTVVNGLAAGGVYQFQWTTIYYTTCPSSTSIVKITDDVPPVGGTTNGTPLEVCSGSNTGSITLSGQSGTILEWESSTNGGASWAVIANTTNSLTFTNLTQTTEFRAIMHSGVCTDAPSTVTTVTVDQPPVVANAGPNTELCGSTPTLSYTLQGNNASPGTGKWTQTSGAAATIVSPTNPNSVVNGLTPGNIYQFTWTITATGTCPTNSSTVKITVDQPPVGGTTAGAAEVCSTSNTGQITLSGQFGNVIRWESSPDGTTWTPIANTGVNLTYSNITQTTQYRAILQNGSVCPNAPSTATTITVDQPPVVANAGASQELCNIITYTLQGNSPSPGTGLWTVTSGHAGTSFSDATNPNAVVSGLIPGNTYTFTWTTKNTGVCAPSSNSVTITDDQAPVGGTTAGSNVVCTASNSGQITLSGQFGSIVRWEYSTDGGTTWLPIANTGTSLSYTNLTQTTEYHAIIHNGVCTDVPSAPSTITVMPLPVTSNPGPNTEICGTATAYTLQGNSPSPGTGLWTVLSGSPSGAIFSNATSPTATVSHLVPGTYQFQWTITGSTTCPSSSNFVTIKVDQPPVGGTTAGGTTVCIGGNSGQITLSGQSGTILEWESSTNGGVSWTPIANTSATLSYLNLTQTTEYQAVLHSGVCTDVMSTISTVVVAPLPVTSNPGPAAEICGTSTTYTLQGNSPSPGTGLWTVLSGPAGSTFSDPTNPTATVSNLIPGTYVFKWTITGSPTCPSSSNTVTIKVDQPPVGGTTAGGTTVCTGSNGGQITLAGQTGTIIRWEYSIDGGTTWQTISNTGTTQPYTNLTQTTEYHAVLHNGSICSDVTSSPSTVIVAPLPITSIAGPTNEVCGATSYALQGNNPSPGTGLWTVVSGPSGVTFSNPTNPNAIANGLTPGNSYVFEWTITTSTTCPSNSSTVLIKDDAPPVGGTLTASPSEVCFGANAGTITLSGQSGTIFGWQMSTDGTNWTAIGNSTTTQSFTNLAQTTEYRAILHNNGVCADVFSTTAIVTVDPLPVVSVPGPNDERCNITTYTLQGNSPSPGAGLWTETQGPPVTFSDPTNPNAIVNGMIPGNLYQFKWTITSSPTSTCPPSSNTVNIKDDAPAVGGSTTGTKEVCSGSNTGTIILAGEAGAVVQWESSIDNGTTWQPVANATASLSYLNLTQTTIFRADIHNGSACSDAISSTTTITVDLPPTTANAGTDDEVCGVTTYTLNGNSPGTGTGLWTITNGPAGATFSNATSPNAIVSGLIPGNIYQFKWTITGASTSCPPSAAVVNITIDKAPVGGTTGTSIAVCSGSNVGQITLSGQFGTIVRWESSIDGGATWQPIANTNTSQSYSNLTQTTSYRAILHNGNVCADVTSTVTTITVNNPPPVANAGTTAELCNATSYTLQGNSPAPATGLWTIVSGPAGATFSDATNANAVVNGLTPGVYQFKWTITGAASCPPSTSTVVITIDAPPVGGTTAGGIAVCSGSNNGQVTLSGQFGNIVRWESSIDGGTTWTPIANTNTSESYNNLTQTTEYRAVLHNGSVCTDVTSTVTTIIVNNPPPVANAGTAAELCNATTYTLQGNNPVPATGLWTILSGPTGATFSDATNPNAVVTGLTPGTYQFKWTITGAASCPPSSSTVVITIDAPPVGGTTAGGIAVCSGNNNGQVTLSGQFGNIVRWESSIDGGATWQSIANTNTSQSYTNLTQTTAYRAVLHNGSVCTDVTSTVTTITVNNPPPVANAGTAVELCNATTYTLQGNNPAPAAGLWSVISAPGTVTFADATNPNTLVSGLTPGVYQFKWTITGAASCPPSTSTVVITIDAPPIGGTTTGSAPVCIGSNNGQISLSGQFGNIVRWESSVDGGTTWVPIANTSNVQVYFNLTQTTAYRAVLHNGNVCADVTSTVATITVNNPPPVANAGAAAELCNAATYTLQGNNPAPATGLWTIISGPAGATFVDATSPNTAVNGMVPGIYQFKWTITGAASCPPSSSTVIISNDAPPIGGTTAGAVPVCSGSNNGQITLSGQFGNIVRWESSVDGGTTWVPITNVTATQGYSNLTQTTAYRAVLQNTSTCPNTTSTVTTITVVSPPPVANAGLSAEVCNATTYTLQGNSPSPGTGLWTVLSGPAGSTFVDATNPNTAVNGMIPDVYQFQWTITGSGPCPPSSSIVTITNDAPPIGGTTAGGIPVCSGSNNGQITLSGQFGNIVRWESSIDGGTTWTAIANTSATQGYANLTQTTAYRAVLHNSATCADVTSTVSTVTVILPPPVANAGAADEVCNVTTYTLQGNSPAPATGLWTIVSGPTGATFVDATVPNAIVIGMVPGAYQFKWTITGSATCPPSSSLVTVTNDAPPVGGTTAGAVPVCSGSNSGQVTLSGQFGTIVRWESSIDGGTTWTPIANVTTSQGYANLTETTEYRAVIHNTNICADVTSTVTTITVNNPPTVANAGPVDEVCNVTTYTLQGNNPAPATGLWTIVSGPTGATFVDATVSNAIVIGMVPGVYQFKWTITGSASCPPSSSLVTVTNDAPPVGGTTAGSAPVCSGSNNGQITLTGQFGSIVRWESSVDGGTTWTPIANVTTTQGYVNLTQTTQYRVVIRNTATCPNVTSTVSTITVNNPPPVANAGSADEVCNVTTYTLQGNSPAPATGLWTIVSGPAGATFVDATAPNAIVTGMTPGVYQFKWTITGSSSCPSSNSVVTISNDQPPVGGTTSGGVPVCSGSNAGVITLSGQFGSIVRWESSIDGGTTWTPIANTTSTQHYSNLTQTTSYRAVLENTTTCPGATSTVSTVTVNAPPVVADAGADATVCSVTSYTLQGNNPAPGTGKWTITGGPAGATFVDATNPGTVVNGLVPGVYQFEWTITGSATCPPSTDAVNITVEKAPVGGTTAGSIHVCSGSNNGQITLSGQFGTVVRWEYSIDGGTTWTPIVNTGTSQTYSNLTQTTEYRTILHNGITCSDVPSTVTTITVDLPPVVANAGTDQEICNITSYTLQGNSPGAGTGLWTVTSAQTGLTFSDATNPNAIVSGLVPGSVYQFKWTITATGSSCPPSSALINLTDDQPPVGGTTATSAEVCSGSNGAKITLSGELGTVVRWESSIDNGTSWVSIANTGTSQTYSNLTQTTWYRAVMHNSSTCPDVMSTITIIKVDAPPITSNAGTDTEVCSVTSFTLQGNSPAPGTGLWTQTGGPSGAVFSDATSPTATVTGLIPGNLYQFKWTITASAFCPPSNSTVNITDDKAPIAGTTSGTTSVCSGSNTGSVTLAGQYGTIIGWQSSTDGGTTWQAIANTGTSQSYTNLTQTTEYRAVIQTTVLCGPVYSTPSTITTVLPAVTANAGSDQEVCNVTSYTLSGNNPGTATGLWTLASNQTGVTFSDATIPNATVNGLVPGVYQFKWTISGAAGTCPPTSSLVNITVDAPPIGGTTAGSAPVCSGSNTGTITLTGQFGNIVRWESSTDNGTTWDPISNTSASESYLNLTQTTQYRAVLHNGNVCTDVTSTVTTITVNTPPPVANAGNGQEVCNVTTYTLQGNSPAPATGKWTIFSGPAGATFTDDTAPNAVVNGMIPGNAYQFKWTITGSASCPASSSIVTIIDDQPPVGGTTSGAAEVCSGSNGGTITLAGQFGTILRWESSVDGVNWTPIANTNNTESYFNLTQTTQFRAVMHNSISCADVTSTPTTIMVDQPPVVANAGPANEVCSVTTYTLAGNNPGAAIGLWTVVSGPPGATFSNPASPNATVSGLIPGSIYQFKWTITPATGTCPPTSDIVNITIDKAPIGGTLTPSSLKVCSGSNTGQINLLGQFGTIVRWESSTDNGTTWTPINNTTDAQAYFNLTQTTEYRVVLTNGAICGNVTSAIAIVTVDPTPTIANAGSTDEVCSVTSYTLNGNNPVTGTGTWTEFNGPAGVTFSNVNDPNATVSGLIPGNLYQFQWTIAVPGSSCPPTTSIVNITDDKAPIGGTTTGAPLEVCSGSNSGEISLAGQYGTIVNWESSTDGGATWQTIANTNNTQHFSNLTQTTEYRAVLHSSSVCTDVRSTPTIITVDTPPIQANAGPDDEVCSSTTYNLNGNSPTPGTGLWTVEGGPAGVTFSDATSPNAIANGLIPGNTYQFKWTITGTASCPPTSDLVNITIDKAPIGGTTAGTNEVCSGSNGGSVTLSGQFGTVVRWESSTNNGSTWTPIANIGVTEPYVNLTQTTEFRAILHNSSTCADVPSTATTITVDMPPIQADAGSDDEVCSAISYHLNGNNPGLGTGLWTVVSGPAGATFVDATSPTTTVNGLIPGNVYQFQWTITGTASCPPTSDIVSITDDKAPIGGNTTTPTSEVCYGNNAGEIDLNGQFGSIVRWEFSTDNGTTWQPLTNTNNTQHFSDLTQTTQFRGVVHNGTSCGDVVSTSTTVIVDPLPVMSVPGPNDVICNATTYTLQGNSPAPGTGLWTVVQGPAGVTFSDPTSQNAVVNGLIPGNIYVFKWAITGSIYCPPSTAVVTITVDQAPVGGTTSSPATVCWGSNAGQINLTGQFGTIVRWESSIDNGASWQPIANTNPVQTYLNLTRTTLYHAVLHNGTSCDDVPSTPTTITVNVPTPISQAGADFSVCNQSIITLNGNDPGAGGGVWTQTAGPAVNILTPSSYSTQVTGLAGDTTYTFKWTIFGLAPCGNTESVINVGVHTDVVPSFTMNKSNGCGPTIVAFTNTSTPAPVGTFVWNFGDGSPSITAITPPPHTFPTSSDGSEKTYNISLTPLSNCASQTPFVAQITVSPMVPIASILPSQLNSCGTFNLTAQNLSPGDNVVYDFYLVDQNGAIVQHLSYPDKETAVFQPVSPSQPTTYQLYMIVTDKCGNQAKSAPIDILGAPSTLTSQIQIKGDISSVCLGSPITFQNISAGGDKFTITLYDANKTILTTIPATTSDLSYTPTAIGTYYVSITAGYVACGDAPASALKEFNVYPNPEPNFIYTVDNDYNVTFVNTTPDAGNVPASTLIYNWDFGDGTMDETTYAPNLHYFNFANAPFVVTLKATTPGSTCFGITTQTLDIKFHGNLFVPNAFMPAGADPALRKFYVKGQGMKTWHMQVFNNWGQLLWESTALDNTGAPTEGWDGTYKGKVCEQGVYIWQISGTLLNGEAWKGMSYGSGPPSKTGPIHLIR